MIPSTTSYMYPEFASEISNSAITCLPGSYVEAIEYDV